MHKILLYYHTLKYLKFKQFLYRLFYRLYQPKISRTVPPCALNKRYNQGSFLFKQNQYFVGENTACFINHAVNIESRHIWNDKTQQKLWLYNLHYFDALNARDIKQRDIAYALLQRWVKENPIEKKGNAWEPYPISLRIVNIIKYALTGNRLDDKIRNSLYIQVRFLNKICEYHLLGNHLFENFKALCFAGLYFQGKESEKWFNKGLKGLKEQVSEQILKDGGHFELSPMYHCIILEGMLDLKNIFTVYDKASLFCWDHEIQNMLNWLQLMMRNPSSISYFNDAADGIAARPSDIFNYAKSLGYVASIPKNGVSKLSSSGYYILQNQYAKVIVDIAKVGPEYLPGHAHADTLSFELMVGEQPVFANLGTSCYGVSERRSFERSTRAHNTVCVNSKDSSQVWASFRVAKRAKPKLIVLEEKEKLISIKSSHDGYRRLHRKLLHTRQFHMEGKSLLIIDELGANCHAQGYLHLHPDCQIVTNTDRHIVIALPNGKSVEIYLDNHYEIQDNHYAKSFGQLKNTKSICYSFDAVRRTARIAIQWGKQ